MRPGMIPPSGADRPLGPCCKSCGATHVVKYGTYKSVQVYRCKRCGKKFRATDAMPGRRAPPQIVGAALSLFYDCGQPLGEIRRNLERDCGVYPSTATIYEWVLDYTRLAKHYLSDLPATTGTTWVASEVVLLMEDRPYSLWDVMDARSRFMLASCLSPTNTAIDPDAALRKALLVSGQPPKRIITDQIGLLGDAIGRLDMNGSGRVTAVPPLGRAHLSLFERLHQPVLQRQKLLRRLRHADVTTLVIDGYALAHNHFWPQSALGGHTPAIAAGIRTSLRDWQDIARLDVRLCSHAWPPGASEGLAPRKLSLWPEHGVVATRAVNDQSST